MKINLIEHKPNETFLHKNVEYVCIEDLAYEGCLACDLYGSNICLNILCDSGSRDDGIGVIYKKKSTLNIMEQFEEIIKKTSISENDKIILREFVRYIASNNN